MSNKKTEAAKLAAKPADVNQSELDQLLQELPEAQRPKEQKLRAGLLRGMSDLRLNQLEMGQILAGYRQLYRHGRWIRFCNAIGIPERTARHYLQVAELHQSLAGPLVEALQRNHIHLVPRNKAVIEKVQELAELRAKEKAAEAPIPEEASSDVADTSEEGICDLGDDEANEIVTEALATIGQPGKAQRRDDRVVLAYTYLERLYRKVAPEIRSAELHSLWNQLGETAPAPVAAEAPKKKPVGSVRGQINNNDDGAVHPLLDLGTAAGM